MPLMRDITCVTSSSSSRDGQRSTAAAGSSPMLSSTMAACSSGPCVGTRLLFASAMLLYPLLDDFGHAFRLLAGKHLQVIDHHVHRRAGRRQVVVLEQRHHRHLR